MTNSEFSDAFTTLLNSYNTQAQFGEQASQREIVLDEYEKSVLLTQAQDIIVKSYFEGAGGQGFDDSARRQVDFSSLIKIADLLPTSEPDYKTFDIRGVVYDLPKNENTDTTEVLYILNEKLIEDKLLIGALNPREPVWTIQEVEVSQGETAYYWFKDGVNTDVAAFSPTQSPLWAIVKDEDSIYRWHLASSSHDTVLADNNEIPGEFLTKEYVIVPINYKEYDREMSKPYAQPLKKQAWRLFQNMVTGFDVKSELIPKFNIKIAESSTDPVIGESILIFRIRYVKRPQPIVLEDLPNGLTIDGISTETPCELNPILHMDILTKAVELAITTRGAAPAQNRQQQQ